MLGNRGSYDKNDDDVGLYEFLVFDSMKWEEENKKKKLDIFLTLKMYPVLRIKIILYLTLYSFSSLLQYTLRTHT